MLIDEVVIHVRSGKGGDGVVHFRREKYVPFGGPDGGDGGRGGDVLLEVKPTLNTLSHFRHQTRFHAEDGASGAKQNMTGRSGVDLVLFVPPATLVYEAQSGEVLGDLTQPGQRLRIAAVGRGGKGNGELRMIKAGVAGLALLALLAGCGPAAVNEARIAAADREPGNWMTHGRTYAEDRFSPLTQVNTGNVSRLGLAWSYENTGPAPAWGKAKEAAEEALALDNSLALAHLVLADRKSFFEWDWDGAEREYRLALDLNSHFAYAHNDFGIILNALGRAEEAVGHAERALELDPNSYMIAINSSDVLFSAGRQEKAISLTKRFQALHPGNPLLSAKLIMLYHGRGMIEDASGEARKLIGVATAVPPDFALQALGYAVLGEESKAREAIQKGADVDLTSLLIWYAYALLGDNDRAFDYLEKRMEKKDANCIYFNQHQNTPPGFRQDPRFSASLRKMGLIK